MHKHFCDKCGKEITDKEMMIENLGGNEGDMLAYYQRFELCPECHELLVAWFKEPPKDAFEQGMEEPVRHTCASCCCTPEMVYVLLKFGMNSGEYVEYEKDTAFAYAQEVETRLRGIEWGDEDEEEE